MRLPFVIAAVVSILLITGSFGYAIHMNKPQLGSWVATGTVTDITGATAHVLMKDGQTYQVNLSDAEVVIRGRITNYLSLRVGDTVKVVGDKIGTTAVKADRALVQPELLASAPPPKAVAGTTAKVKPEPKKSGKQRVLKVYGEEQPTEGAPSSGYTEAPSVTKPPAPPVNFVRRGFVADVQYSDRTMTLQTSGGLYDVDLSPAAIVKAGRLVGIGSLSPGDAVQVSGQQGDERTIIAARLNLLNRSGATQQSPDIQRRVVTGAIYWIDYPSFTFKMRGAPQATYVMADEGTAIRDGRRQYKFTSLGPGLRVKVTGYGSPSGGYVAEEVFVISVIPSK